MNELDYVKTPPPYKGAIVFSPSKFSTFVDKPWQWYREEVLKEGGFDGNTSSVAGTITHYIAECVANSRKVDKAEIARYIAAKEPSEDYDPNIVKEIYQEMAEALINNYVLDAFPSYIATEKQLTAKVSGDYHVGGTIDVIEGTMEDCCITDYKTYNSATKPKSMPSYYKYQLLTYAVMALANGYNVSRIRLVYVSRPIIGEYSPKTGKQFKSYPSEVTVLTESVTAEDLTFIRSMHSLAVDSLEAAKKYPELLHIIFHDPRLLTTP